ncbi:MAG TPA: SusD/RagB family nutrient-binding outer membrane lipoprotein [Flavisolibacter sp.]|nr:SusD/RagB family nutrient-binding outer membrane lipoprotein [Flavisolibacter sp.]
MKKIFVILFMIFTLGACEKKLDKLLENPNLPTPESADATLYLNQVQLGFAGFFNGASSFGLELTRMIHFYGPTYTAGYSAQSFDGLWTTAYATIFKNANALIPIAEQQRRFVNSGMARILKAYTAMTLVDMFGDIPFSEANAGIENTNPKLDKGQNVYVAAIKLLDEAIADLGKTSSSFPGSQDLFYGASNAAGAARWTTLAKTLKLRAYLQTYLVDPTAKAKIDALLTENDLIDTPAEDFEFKYGTRLANPNTRHPRYTGNYTAIGSAGDYIANYFMWSLAVEKGMFSNNPATDNSDPRTRYYIYRQRTNNAEVTQVTKFCSVTSPPTHYVMPGWQPYTNDVPYCTLPAGFWGRDHGDNSGIPPDGPLRSTVGIYPFGGDFDANQGASVGLNRGAQGAGIQPILLSTFTHFMKAEAALVLGSAGNARDLLQAGIRSSFSKVFSYPATVGVTVPSQFVPSQARQDAYVSKVVAAYDAASTTDQRLDVVIKEYYLSLWGNGVDSYNTYRRTCKPSNMQPMVTPNSGSFAASHYYPSVHVNLNKNATQKSNVTQKVFWDNKPTGCTR